MAGQAVSTAELPEKPWASALQPKDLLADCLLTALRRWSRVEAPLWCEASVAE